MGRLLLTMGRRAAYARKVRRLAPIAYWPLWENSGTTAFDQSGNSRNGTYTGVDLGQPGVGDGRTAPYFDGTNDYAQLTGAPLTSFAGAFSATTGTLSLWFRMLNAGVWTDGAFRFATVILADTNNYVRAIKTNTSNLFQLAYAAGGTQKFVNITMSPTVWTHVAITWDKPADQVRVYAGGTQSGSTQTGLGTWAGSITAVTVGAQNNTPTLVHNGWLAHAAVWARTLSAGEIASLARVY